jgi:hypothetical protein
LGRNYTLPEVTVGNGKILIQFTEMHDIVEEVQNNMKEGHQNNP